MLVAAGIYNPLWGAIAVIFPNLLFLLFYRVWEPWLLTSFALIAVNWISTWRLQIPLHDALSNGFDQKHCRQLVRTNWIRTIAWSLRGCMVTITIYHVAN